MKLGFTYLCLSCLGLTASAQYAKPIYDFKKISNYDYVGHIYGMKAKPGTDTLFLYIGGKYPKQQLTVIVRYIPKRFKADTMKNWVGKDVVLHGYVNTESGIPVMTVTDSTQIKIGYLTTRFNY